jgi:molecular chaperone HtpG
MRLGLACDTVEKFPHQTIMSTILEQGNITIHTENIFPIIKKSLYTDHEIFLRELIANGVDAIGKLKMVSMAGELQGELGEAKITLAVDKEKKTLSITDTGIGMTAEEVKKYINQVAFSSAEEFIEKYQKSADQQIIGHFGLGFYSAFMVASLVEIDTFSYKEGATPVHWSCDGSPQFTISESDRTTRGTTITLTLQEEELEYAEEARVKQLVKTYCDFMPVKIELNDEQINKQRALWKESPQNLTKEDYLEFYRYQYPYESEPLLWVHLNTDYPFLLNGILYFPKLKPEIDVTKSQAKLFCNQVFVSDNCEEVIPKFLTPLRGVIDSPDVPLNVSRSALTNDRTVKRIGDHIAKKVGDRLKEIYQEDRAAYISAWQDLGTFVKFGMMNDEKFKKQAADITIFRTTWAGDAEEPKVEVETADGDAWQSEPGKNTVNGQSFTTLQEYLERNKEKQENRVFYCTDEVTQATYVSLYKNRGIEVLFLDSFIDNHFATFLEQEFSEVKFSRIDSDLDESLIEKENSEVIDPVTNMTLSDRMKEVFTAALDRPQITIRTESLKSDNPSSVPPAMVLLPEEQRRMQEMMAMMQQQLPEFPAAHILMVNTAHPLIQNLAAMSQGADDASGKQELVNLICQHVYDLALMAQKGFNADTMNAFVDRSNQVLTQLTDR